MRSKQAQLIAACRAAAAHLAQTDVMGTTKVAEILSTALAAITLEEAEDIQVLTILKGENAETYDTDAAQGEYHE